jgi:decaprenyl-phosphate phosphoribosyltransferase
MFILMLNALRPNQWIKNSLVAIAPVADGVIQTKITSVVLGILGFIFASSIGYLINDWMDRESDRLHDKKRTRPFAANTLQFKHLLVLLVMCSSGLLTICIFLSIHYLITIVFYIFLTISYSLGVKKVPIFEMAVVSFGFLIRALAGSAIIGKLPSSWFLLLIFFGSLFIVSGKRISEIKIQDARATRLVTRYYTPEFLNVVFSVSLSITIMTYSLWIFQVHKYSIPAQFTIILFSMSMFYYAYLSEFGKTEAPELVVVKSKAIFITMLFTTTILVAAVYL